MEQLAARLPTGNRTWERVERGVLRFGAFLLPLTFFWDTFDRFALARLLTARVLLVALAVLYVGRWIFGPTARFQRTAVDLPLLAFLVSALLSTVVAVNRNVAIFGTYVRYEGLLTLLMYAGIFWLTVQLVSGTAEARGFLRAMLVGAYVVSVAGIVQSLIGYGPGADRLAGPCIRAFVTFGSPVELAAFLAMLWPVALDEVLSAASRANRVLAINLSIVLGLALLLTLTRSAWVGAFVGTALVVYWRRPRRRAWIAMAAASVLLLVLGVIAAKTASPGSLPDCVAARTASLAAPAEGSAGARLHIWGDTVNLIGRRPVLGYGPDTFGLVYPLVQSGDWTPGLLLDKAHADLLQITATQGLVGLGAWLWLLVAFVYAFWHSGRAGPAVAVFAGWAAYEIAIQPEFSWVPAAAPFWLFAGCAVACWTKTTADRPRPSIAATKARIAGTVLVAAAGLAVALVTVIPPYAADRDFFEALNDAGRGQFSPARAAINRARRLAPQESVYAIAAGNIALRLDARGAPGTGADWTTARDDYETAIQLGAFNPAGFRNLALADMQLGRTGEAIAAARQALELDRFDPASQALVRQLSPGSQ